MRPQLAGKVRRRVRDNKLNILSNEDDALQQNETGTSFFI